jgi:hypothetical protein
LLGLTQNCAAPFGGNGFVVAHVTYVQDHRDFSRVLPPVRRALGFGADFAYLADDGSRTIPGIFDDLALLDKNEGRTVFVALPRDDATWLNHDLRKRNSWFAILAFSFPRSIDPRVVSVTATVLKSTGWRAFAMRLPAGHRQPEH